METNLYNFQYEWLNFDWPKLKKNKIEFVDQKFLLNKQEK